MPPGVTATTVRPPAVYGPRDRDMFELFRAARRGVVPMPPPGRASMIHVEDLARLLLALVPGGEDVSGATFEPDDGRGRRGEVVGMARQRVVTRALGALQPQQRDDLLAQ